MSAHTIDSLTPREREILTLIAEGDSLAEIAQKLSRSLKTIESHRLSLGRKLKANNRVELAKIAFTSGLVSLEIQAQTSPSPAPTTSDDHHLKRVNLFNACIQQATGKQLLQRFCIAASKLPGIDVTAICICETGHASDTIAPYGHLIMAVSGQSTDAKQTHHHSTQISCYPQDNNCIAQSVQRLLPDDAWLKAITPDRYLEVPLYNIDRKKVGGIGLLSQDPIDDLAAYQKLIDFFTPRLSGAIEVCREIESLRCENDRLHADLVAPLIPSDVAPIAAKHEPYRAAFERIAERIHPLAGAAFLHEIVAGICQELALYAGGVCKLESQSAGQALQSMSFCMNGQQDDSFSADVPNTPCETVLTTGHSCYEDHVAQAYPEDKFLTNHNIKSYCGIRLPSPTGQAVGIIWFADQSNIAGTEPIKQLLQFYAPRIGAELFHFIQLETLHQEREKLQKQLVRCTEDPSGNATLSPN